MTRTYSLIIEGDANGYSAYVPELPTILVTGASIEDLTARAKAAIRLYWETLNIDRSPASTVREIEVELPA
jgi:predicted RNase H-like HicB family nuclease